MDFPSIFGLLILICVRCQVNFIQGSFREAEEKCLQNRYFCIVFHLSMVKATFGGGLHGSWSICCSRIFLNVLKIQASNHDLIYHPNSFQH